MIARGIERDRVHSDAELLDQLQFRRRGDEVRRDRGQHVEQHGDIGRHFIERCRLVDMDNDAGAEDRIDRFAKTGAGARVEDDHAATRPIDPAKAEKPANSALPPIASRSEEHKSELQSLMRITYAVFCLKKKKI